MFEIFGVLGNGELPSGFPMKTGSYYESKGFKIRSIESGALRAAVLYHENEASLFENGQYIVGLLGSAYYQLKWDKGAGALSAKDVLELLLDNQDILSKIKGNFTVVLFDKSRNSLSIINDHFGLRPFYYSNWGEAFYFSNNLSLFKELKLEINEPALLERILYSYPLNADTYYKGVSLLGGGEVIEAMSGTVMVTQQFNLKEFIFASGDDGFNDEYFIGLVNQAVLQRCKNRKIAVSLTGGFDGRCIVSVLLKNNIDFFAYSFGKKHGENTEIPMRLANELNFEYLPIYLDEDFEERFQYYANEAIYFSGGQSIVNRANYPYAFDILSRRVRAVITGLLGGEILRPIYLKEDYINHIYYNSFYAQRRQEAEVELYLKKLGLDSFLKKDFIIKNKGLVKERAGEKWEEISKVKVLPKGYLYLMYDLIKSGFRRYYGTEIALERPYCENLNPLFDYDILSYIFSTNYKTIFRQAFKSSPVSRWRGQVIYAKIMRSNCEPIGRMAVDRGYPPEYLIHPLKRLLIPYFYYRRKSGMKKREVDFATETWSEMYFKSIARIELKESNCFEVKEIARAITKADSIIRNEEFNKLFSIYYWKEIM